MLVASFPFQVRQQPVSLSLLFLHGLPTGLRRPKVPGLPQASSVISKLKVWVRFSALSQLESPHPQQLLMWPQRSCPLRVSICSSLKLEPDPLTTCSPCKCFSTQQRACTGPGAEAGHPHGSRAGLDLRQAETSQGKLRQGSAKSWRPSET